MNKRLLFILPLMLLSFSGFSQLQKGNKILGGTINYSSSTTNFDLGAPVDGMREHSSFTISPIVGIFVSNRTVVGLVVDLNTYSSENLEQGIWEANFDSDRFGFGPFVRRYFPVKEWVAFYGQAEMRYSTEKAKQTYGDPTFSNQNYERDIKTFSVATSLGLAFFPTNWMSLDLAINPLSYAHHINRNETSFSVNEFNTNNFDFNLTSESFFIGAHFFFNKK